MKNVKKLMALLTVVAISITCLTGCGDKGKIEKAIEGYVKCVTSMDFNGALEYLSEDNDQYSAIEGMAEMMSDGLGAMLVQQMISEADVPEDLAEELGDEISGDFEKLIDDIMKNVEIEIDSVEIDDDKATVDYVMTIPDFQGGMDDVLSMDDLEEIFEEETDGEDIEDMSDDEKVDVTIKVVKKWIDSVDTSDIDTTEQEGTMELEKVDGDWLILSDEEK